MSILDSLMSEHGPELLSSLTDSGFSSEQAEAFLPEAASSVGDALSGGGIASMLGGGDDGDVASELLSKIDIQGLATKLGMDPTMAESGLSALIPKLLSLVGSQSGGLSGLLGGGAGGLAGLAGKLFNK